VQDVLGDAFDFIVSLAVRKVLVANSAQDLFQVFSIAPAIVEQASQRDQRELLRGLSLTIESLVQEAPELGSKHLHFLVILLVGD